jgi:hypothetical protein
MAVIPSNPTFRDIQAILEAVLANSNFEGTPPPNPLRAPNPHKFFWRQTGVYAQDYTLFTTGNVPGVRPPMPIMNRTKGQELTSNFFVVLTAGLPPRIPQMPDGGPFITDDGYQISVNGTNIRGQDIQDTLAYWLTHDFPQ